MAASGTPIVASRPPEPQRSSGQDRTKAIRGYAQLTAIAATVFWIIVCTALFLHVDAYTYLGAGERLNAGHELYALQAGDRHVGVWPGLFAVPLVYPPPIAILWQPLAAMPAGMGLWLWWSANAVALLAAVTISLRAGILGALLAVGASVGVGMTLAGGNVNGFLVLGAVALWIYRDRPAVGIIVGLMAGAKLLPIVFVAWLLGTRRPQAVLHALVTLVALGLLTGVAVGWDIFEEYVNVLRSIPPYPRSLATALGVPWIAYFVFAIGSIATVLAGLARRDGLSFRLAIVTYVLASPTFEVHSLYWLLAVAAPSLGDDGRNARLRQPTGSESSQAATAASA